MRSIGLVIIIIGAIPIIFVKPHVGVLVWSWLSYMNPHKLTWGATSTFGFAQIIAIATIFAWLISREPKRIPWNPVTVLLVAFSLWMSLTTAFALVPEAAFEKWKLVMKIMLITFITLPLMRSHDRLHALIWVIVVSIGLYGVTGGVFVILTGGQYLVFGPEDTFIGANNALALALIMIFPLMRYLQVRATAWWIRWGLAGAMGLCALSVLSSYSRGAFIAILAMLCFLWLKSSRKFLIGVVGVVTLAGAMSFMPNKWFDRIETIRTYEEDGSAMGRIKMWKFGLRVAKDRPVIGGGFEIYPEATSFPRYGLRRCEAPPPKEDCVLKPRSSHSIYFEVLGEHGFVGLILYLLMGLQAFRTGTWVMRKAKGRPELDWAGSLAAMLQTSFVGYAVGGLFVNKAYFDLFYHLVAIMILTRLIASAQLEDRESREVEAAAAPSRQPALPAGPAGTIGPS